MYRRILYTPLKYFSLYIVLYKVVLNIIMGQIEFQYYQQIALLLEDQWGRHLLSCMGHVSALLIYTAAALQS